MKKYLILTLAAVILAASTAMAQDDWAFLGKYASANAELKKSPKAVFMGDSITQCWPDCDAGFFSDNNFACRGISGQTTSHMLVRMRKDVVALHPKYVVILAGTNDIAKNNGDITLENVLGNIESMCELAKVHKIKPIICSVLPAAAYRWRKGIKPADDIVKLNGMLYEYAKSKKIPYVDYHSVLKDENNGLPEVHAADGVHPNIDCYKIMEKIILEYIK